MEYIFVEKPLDVRGTNWFGHQISFYLPTDRKEELNQFLEDAIGKRGRAWRIKTPHINHIFVVRDLLLCFSIKQHAMQFKLSWEEDTRPETSILNWMKKFGLNSMYGSISGVRGGAMSATAPSWSMPIIGPTTSGIIPTTSANKIYQAKSRVNNLCNEIVFLDYESSINLDWYDHLIEQQEVLNWQNYQNVLDLEIRREKYQPKTTVERKSPAFQEVLLLTDQSGTTGGI